MDYISIPVATKSNKLRDLLLELVNNSTNFTQNAYTNTSRKVRRFKFNKKNIGTFAFIAIVGLAIFFSTRVVLKQIAASRARGVLGNTTSTPSTATKAIDREFSFVVYDKNKELADPIRYIIDTVQLTDQIIIQGQRATAVKGRKFLIVNLKLINDSEQSLFLNTRNYVRVQPEGSQDKLAPEIHNDTVEVQPLSTKLTRIGLPVDETDKNFILFVGELDKDKEQINISF